jgi:hypothetical protein
VAGRRSDRYVNNGKRMNQALPLRTRDDRILAERLAYALRHPVSDDAVLLEIKAAELLLHRLAPVEELEESEDHDA